MIWHGWRVEGDYIPLAKVDALNEYYNVRRIGDDRNYHNYDDF